MHGPQPAQPPRPFIPLLVAVTATGPLALNAIVPSLPAIADAFGTTYGEAQLLITGYLVAVAIGQLIYGPLSDRFGRRMPLLIGMALYFIGGAMCLMAGDVTTMVIGRVIQAVGGCAGMVLTRAIVRDVWAREDGARVLAYVTVAMAAAPAIAPALGGILQEQVGWQGGFALLTVFGGACLVGTALSLRETNLRPTARLPGPVAMLVEFADLTRVPGFAGWVMNGACTTAIFFAFLAGAPYLAMTVLGGTPTEYGLWFVGLSLTFMTGSFITARFVNRLGIERTAAIGNLIMMAGAVTMLGLALLAPPSGLALFVPIMVVTLGNGLIMPTSVSAAVSLVSQRAGAASGLMGFTQMSLAALASIIVGLADNTTAVPMGIAMTGISAMAWLAFRSARRAARRAPPSV